MLFPGNGLDAASKIAREAFKKTNFIIKNIDSAVKMVRKKAKEKRV